MGLTPETNMTMWWLLLGLVVVALSREEPSGTGQSAETGAPAFSCSSDFWS